jgi:hypothetical protein
MHGPSRSAKVKVVRSHFDCAGPNATDRAVMPAGTASPHVCSAKGTCYGWRTAHEEQTWARHDIAEGGLDKIIESDKEAGEKPIDGAKKIDPKAVEELAQEVEHDKETAERFVGKNSLSFSGAADVGRMLRRHGVLLSGASIASDGRSAGDMPLRRVEGRRSQTIVYG